MISVLAPPASGVRSAGRRVWLPRLLGLVLLLAALTGATAWVVTLSPFQLERWRATDPPRAVTISEPGTYVLFEEGPGAATRRGDAEVIPSVRSIAGRPVEYHSLLGAGGRSPQTYDVGIHEGRAIGAVDIHRPGRYIIVTFWTPGLDPSERDRSRRGDAPGLAFGPEGEPSPWGTFGGLLLLAGLPAAAGAIVLTVARWRWPLPLGPVLRPDPPR